VDEARLNLERTGSEIRDFYTVHQLVKDMLAVRRRLGVLNKGMIVLLSAIWEGSTRCLRTGLRLKRTLPSLTFFVELRNAIAHRGLRDTAVPKTKVKNFNMRMTETVSIG
jgi:hypothetical protein